MAHQSQAWQKLRVALPVQETQPDTRTDIDTTLLRRLCPPYKVLLHNDDHHEMVYVIQALIRTVPNLSLEEAARIMLTAHFYGVAVVIICPREAAEYYREGLEAYGLTATIERDE